MKEERKDGEEEGRKGHRSERTGERRKNKTPAGSVTEKGGRKSGGKEGKGDHEGRGKVVRKGRGGTSVR
jgi:hypothetical protein